MALWEAGRIDGFAWEPGAHANYEYGTNELLAGIAHITAGACGGDRAIGFKGYFNAYAPKVPNCGPGRTQFSYIDAADWGACNWNGVATHLEVEKLTVDELMTEYQIESTGLWIRKLAAVGINVDLYRDTPTARLVFPRDLDQLVGIVTHRSLDTAQCGNHSDGWPREEYEAAYAYAFGPPSPVPIPDPPAPPPDPNEGNDDMGPKLIRWHDATGEHLDLVCIADDGSAFVAQDNAMPYYVAGPKAADPAQMTTEAVKVDQRPEVIIDDGQLRFRLQAQGGPDGPGTGVIECFWNATNPAGDDLSLWASVKIGPGW